MLKTSNYHFDLAFRKKRQSGGLKVSCQKIKPQRKSLPVNTRQLAPRLERDRHAACSENHPREPRAASPRGRACRHAPTNTVRAYNLQTQLPDLPEFLVAARRTDKRNPLCHPRPI